MKTCLSCHKELPENEFYNLKSHGNSDGKYPYCKNCSTAKVRFHQQSFKKLCVDYMGGECSICGYNKCIAALEFHHLDPSKKDFAISSIRTTTLLPEVMSELDKCIIVCSNCHAEIHYRYSERDSNSHVTS